MCDFKVSVAAYEGGDCYAKYPNDESVTPSSSIFGRVRAHSWGLELSCGFEMGLIDPISMDHGQP